MTLSKLTLIAAMGLAPAAFADPITVENPFVFETPAMARAGGGFLTITNTGAEPDTLLGVEADFPKVEIHETRVADGRATMRPAGALEIAPGETLSLAPGGLHVMFMGLSDPFEAGETVPVTLLFDKAGAVAVEMPVVPRDSAGMGAAHGHGQMPMQGDGS